MRASGLKTFALVCCYLIVLNCAANEVPKVPSVMEFAGMKLKLTKSVQQEIQRDVDALHASRKYFDIKLDRVNLYFPLIEKAFKEEDLPDDFKYLAIQESALISDAVSSANAVGFWQFKEIAGNEVGLRIDKQVDERLNIVSSSHGAAKYLKRHQFFFRNWIYSLMAYNTGLTGAKPHTDKSLYGVKTMPIDNKMHWYVKKFLAYKVAFENEIGGKHSEGLELKVYTQGGGKSLAKIAKELNIEYSLLAQYNKWLYKGDVPEEKAYPVIIPVVSGKKFKEEAAVATNSKEAEPVVPAKVEKTYPQLGEELDGKLNALIIKLNGLPALMAHENDNLKTLAARADLSIKQLVKYNEISDRHPVIPGSFYYLKKKRSKARLYYYTVQPDETLWEVSQKFGIKVRKLAKLNRMSIIDKPKAGRVLWMRKKRPRDIPVEYRQTELDIVAEVNKPQEKPKPKPEIGEKTNSNELAEAEKPTQERTQENAVEKQDQPIEKASDTKVVENKSARPNGKRTHTVAEGETLYGISRLYDVTVEHLQELNDMSDYVIKPGQSLIISAVAVPAVVVAEEHIVADITFHEVQPGETLYGISRKYNITVEKLMEINNKENYNLSVGEKLKVVQ